MLVDYQRKSQSKYFEFCGSVDVGSKYPRLFWKEVSTNRICCFWSICNSKNAEIMKVVHKDISNRITSVSFGEGCKSNEEPKWKLTGLDESGNPKSVTYTHSELKELITGSKILDYPFALGNKA